MTPDEASGDPAGRDVRLVGRDPEVEVLEGEVRRISAGRFRLCLIEGSAGVGKSRLMSEVVARHAESLRVLSARCYRLGLTSSFGPLLEAFDRYALEEEDAGVGRLRAGDGEGSPDRNLLLDRMTRLLDELGRKTPTLLAIDDLHLADASSWEALRFIARRLHSRPVGVLATARSGGLRQNPLATDVLHALADDGSLRRVNLRPLNLEEVSELVRARLTGAGVAPPGIPQALVEWLNERSLGHPLFILSLLDALLEEAVDLAAPDLSEVPASLRERVALELPALEPAVRQLFELLAVWDRRAGPHELSRALERDLSETGRALEILCASGLVEEKPAANGYVYEVAHPLIQESVYELIGGARRMALHRSVARVLFDQGEWGAAAAHFARSAMTADDETVDALCRAISHAESKGLYREALTILSGLPDLIERGDPRWLRVLDSITWQADWVIDHLVEGDAEEAIVSMRRIEDVSRHESDPVALGTIRFHLASFLAIGAGRLDEAESACRSAIELFRDAGEGRRELLARNEMVWIHSCAGELERSIELAGEVLEDATSSQPLVVNQVAGARAYALGLMGRFEESEALYALAERVAVENGMTYRKIWGLAQQSLPRALEGRLADAVAAVEQALALDHAMACDALALERLAHCRWLEGDLSACVRLMDESGARRALRGSRRRAWGLAVAARALAEMGHSARAERYLEQAKQTYTGDAILDWSAWCSWTEGHLRFLEGELSRAVRSYERAASRYRAMKAMAAEPLVLFDLGVAAGAANDESLAGSTAARLRNLTGRIGGTLAPTIADLVDGIAERTRGTARPETFVDAAQWLQRSGYLLHAETTARLAGSTLRDSDPEKAVEMLETSARIADASGATWRRDRSLRLLKKLGSSGRKVVGAILGPQSLTPREKDVAELAARGYTAAEIADQLFIGRRTVESHLANIYPKLGVSSKRELVIRAADLGLTDPST